MCRYSVSLPPITLINPDADSTTAWSRETSAVWPAPVSISGRSPAYEPMMSSWSSVMPSAVFTTSSRKVISPEVGCGTSGMGPGDSSSVRPK